MSGGTSPSFFVPTSGSTTQIEPRGVAGGSGFQDVRCRNLTVTNMATFAGTITASAGFQANDGAAATPSYAFTDDTNLGLYRIGADVLGIAANGAEVARFGTAGLTLATALAVASGGTGLTTFGAAGAIPYSTAATTLAALAAGSNGQLLTLAAGLPAWVTRAVNTSSPLSGGGSLAADLTIAFASQDANAVLSGPASGPAAAPTFRALVADDIPSLSTDKLTSGTLGVARGGTGLSTFTAAGGIAYATAATTLAVLAIGAADTVLYSTGSAPAWRTLSAQIDAAIGSTRGSILYRGASAWAALTPGTSGDVLTSNGAGADPTYQTPASSTAVPLYGDGSDGAVSLSGNTTLTRDMFYSSLTTNGFALTTAGYRVFVSGTCTVSASGSIRNNGGNASSNTAGTGAASAALGGGANGGAGGLSSPGSPGSSKSVSLGGAGGNGSGPNYGAGGSVSAPAASGGSPRFLAMATLGVVFDGGALAFVQGGAGGGGGDGSGGGAVGGGGGGGGGVVMVCCKELVLTGTIQANGGNAALGASGGYSGGGGGGGVVLLAYGSKSGAGSVTASGGDGAGGNNGAAGTVVEIAGT